MNSKTEKQLQEILQGEEENIQDSLDYLDEKLSQEGWEEKAVVIIESSLDTDAEESIERNLFENFNTHLDDKTASTILSVLANNAPELYEAQNFDVTDRCTKFFQNITARYGLKVKQAIKKYYTPNDWRFVDTDFLSVSREGPHLQSTLLKWNGETVILTSSLPDAITFSAHFIKNLHLKIDPESLNPTAADEMFGRLQDLEGHIKKLRSVLPVNQDTEN